MKTYIEILKFGVEGYPLTDVVNNIDEDEFENAAKEYAKQFTDLLQFELNIRKEAVLSCLKTEIKLKAKIEKLEREINTLNNK